MAIQRVAFVGVTVSDQDTALAFWRDVVGLGVSRDAPMASEECGGEPGGPSPMRWIELKIDGADTGLVLTLPMGPDDKPGKFVNMAFWTDDLDGTYKALEAKGVVFTTPPTQQRWGAYALFNDPDGNTFCLSAT